MPREISKNEVIIARSHEDIIDWCNRNNITIEKFNQPVIIFKDTISCEGLFNVARVSISQ